jgi:hypothetical protein
MLSWSKLLHILSTYLVLVAADNQIVSITGTNGVLPESDLKTAAAAMVSSSALWGR